MTHVKIIGKNETIAEVTGQNELLTKVGNSASMASEIGTAVASSLGKDPATVSYVKVAAVGVQNWNAATGFTSDAIPFPTNKPWSIQVVDYAISSGTPTLTILVSLDNMTYSIYKPKANLINISDTENRVIFDDILNFSYMKIQYVSNSSVGTFSLLISK